MISTNPLSCHLSNAPSSESSRDVDRISSPTHLADSRYRYRKLQNTDSIRLLKLLPGRKDDPLICSMIATEVNVAPAYAAISYVWGDPNDIAMITVDGKNQPVTVNLRDVLQRVRHISDARILWADAVCINQEDLEERGQQVRLMASIFSSANHVVAWLGKDDGDVNAVSTLIQNTAMSIREQLESPGGSENIPEVLPDDLVLYDHPTWTSLAKMLCRPFFSRCWIVQEICLAKIIFALCGDIIIDWDDLVVMSIWIATKGQALQEYFDLGTVLSISTMMLPYEFQQRSRHNEFLDIISRGRSYETSDPKDHIYAFLSHPYALWNNAPIVQPDYAKSVREVYIEVASKIMESTSHLKLLAQVEHEQQMDLNNGFPSWVPRWNFCKRCLSMGFYDNMGADFEQPREVTCSNGALKVRGICFDAVFGHSETMHRREYFIPRNDEEPIFMIDLVIRIKDEFCREKGVLSNHFHDFWWTMSVVLTAGLIDTEPVGNRTSEHFNNFAAYLLRSYDISLSRNDGVVNPETFNDLRESCQSGNWIRFMVDAGSACHYRKLFFTRKGFIGLGPAAMQVGDLCCILFGAKVPYILRPVSHHFVLVGESYIHGVMRGELVNNWQTGDLEAEYFELC